MTCRPAASTQNPATTPRPSEAVLDRLTRLHPKVIDLSLGRIERLLLRLGSPERALPPVVHVAGTNGKGSVIAYLRAMLEAAGRRVHVYTSPHLTRFHERIRLSGALIEEGELVGLLEECEAANGPSPITFFEITTAAAFLAFTRHPADILLLETGLGGRLDATNVVERPLLSVITPVSIDHTQFLGDTLEAIAAEKAGILKPGVPAVIGPQPAQARAVIEARAQARGTPLARAGSDWRFEATDRGFTFVDGGTRRDFDRPALPGAHQIENAAMAVAAAGRLGGFGLDDGALGRGLAEARWPGRLQILTAGPLPALLPDGWELWLDGGHNAAAGLALAAELGRRRDRPLHLVFGMMNSKAVRDFLAPLAPLVRSLHAVAIPGEPNSLSAEAAAGEAGAVGCSASPAPDVAAALARIAARADGPGRVLICGSLYLAGRVLADNA
jgi:dihydrofolate synthase/folylpolyglutamate synthase